MLSLSPQERHALHAKLTPLVHPDLTIVLHTAGTTVGKRHPAFHDNPEAWGAIALDQMRALDFQSGPYRHVDATASPQAIVRHVTKLLESKVFHVQTAFDGMEHLGSEAKRMTPEEATTFANSLPLWQFSTDAEGLARLN